MADLNTKFDMAEESDPSTPAANRITIYAKDIGGVSTYAIIGDDGTVWVLSGATTSLKGMAELATAAEAAAGTDSGRVVTPSLLPVLVQDSKYTYAADAEASDTYVITLTPAPAAYATGQVFSFKANTANTGAATLNVNALGAKTIKKLHDQDLATGDIEAGQIVLVVYDGTNFQMLSQLASAAAGGTLQDRIPGSAFSPTLTGGATAPLQYETSTNAVNYWGLQFGDDDKAYCVLLIPADYAGGDIKLTFLWTSAGTGNNTWGGRGLSFGDSDALDTAMPAFVTAAADAGNASEDVNKTAQTAAINFTGALAGEYAILEVTLSGTANNSPVLLGVLVDYDA